MSQSECLLFAQLVFGDDVPFLNYSDSVWLVHERNILTQHKARK